MLHSMTGYGRASGNYGDKTITAEIRALNSKLTDLKMRLPGDYKEKELELRKLVIDKVERGKIDLLLDVQTVNGATTVMLNESLFKGYFNALTKIAAELNIPTGDLMQSILRIPNIVAAPGGDVDEDEWAAICQTVEKAIENFNQFRAHEGIALESDLQERLRDITLLQKQIEPFEKERTVKMREKLRNNLEEGIGKENVDKNRYEQEILFYLEKMDINEEKVRLEQHCNHFLEQMSKNAYSKGRTLNFIAQEMGREINTLGAKAYDSDIQKIVVKMKDELEKIKEQLANVI